MSDQQSRRSFLSERGRKILAGVLGGAAAVALVEGASAGCAWYDDGTYCSCGAYASCWMSGGYGKRKRQRYFCNGVPTGAIQCVKAFCGC